MVVDDGFDLSVSELRGRVAAVYTETCVDEPTPGADAAVSPDTGAADAGVSPDTGAADAGAADAGVSPDTGAADAGVSFDQMKQDLIAALSVPDDSCHLTAGIGAKADPFPSIAQYRDRWNAMVRGNEFGQQAFTQAEFTQITNVLDAEFQNFRYHGTATSGTVVHDNPTVRLVLVERQLLTEASAQSSFVCFLQSDIDQAVQLFSDTQVFAALVNQPAQIEAEISAVETQYDVGLVNESFGASSREALEALQLASNCPTPIDLSAYFAILDQAALAHAATIQGPAVLTVQAAGNDGAQIDSGADSLSCDIGDPLSLLVGSYNPGNQVRNTFSDFGACVDVYAPGQSIVAPYAGDWLLWVAGTSFSSPMVARYVSLNAPAPFAPAQARTDLLALRGADGSLPVALFPSDSFYAPDEATTAALIAVPSPLRASPRSPSRVDLHRILHPLSLLRALRRR